MRIILLALFSFKLLSLPAGTWTENCKVLRYDGQHLKASCESHPLGDRSKIEIEATDNDTLVNIKGLLIKNPTKQEVDKLSNLLSTCHASEQSTSNNVATILCQHRLLPAFAVNHIRLSELNLDWKQNPAGVLVLSAKNDRFPKGPWRNECDVVRYENNQLDYMCRWYGYNSGTIHARPDECLEVYDGWFGYSLVKCKKNANKQEL